MFLEVKRASCSDVLDRLMKMIRTILEYSIRTLVQEPDFDELSGEFEEEFQYLLKRKPVKRAVEALFELTYLERVDVCDGFENDAAFEEYIDDDSYQFRELTERERKVLSGLCNEIYKAVRRGLPPGDSAHTQFSVGMLKKQFVEENDNFGKVCPVCIRELLFDDREGEADHYFPRKKYPALTLHPYNILPVCSDCNGASVKHEKSPLADEDRGPGELRYVFLPYLRAAKPEVEFEVSDDESRRIVMHPAAGTGPYTQRRIENMERLYSLGERWGKVLQHTCDDIRSELAEKCGPSDSDEERLTKLRKLLEANRESTKGRSEFVKGVYCGWLLKQTDEMLLGVFSRDSYLVH